MFAPLKALFSSFAATFAWQSEWAPPLVIKMGPLYLGRRIFDRRRDALLPGRLSPLWKLPAAGARVPYRP